MVELHVVALSGGKDSTAMALRLAEVEPRDYTYVCTPTGNELPEMFAHWRKCGELLGKPILPIMATTLGKLIERQAALPNWRQRWCTRLLKIEPYAAWLRQQSAQGLSVVSYVGLRADEEEREGGDYTRIQGATTRFPMREWGWGLGDVTAYLADRGVTIPKRTDCAVCFYQRIGEWYALWRDHPEEYAKGEAWEELTGYTFRSPGRDTWPAGLRDLRLQFDAGRVPRGMAANENDKIAEMKCRVCRL
jgi:3'-phosphoadenosine 5'-phosphosulfate sulfotransferase (PAPS reductase)/FAD synthetase